MPYQFIKYEKREDHIGVITLNRPDRLNALSRPLWEELSDAVGQVERDNDVRVFLLTGASRADGRPCFSAGADLKARAESGGTPAWFASDVVNRIDEMLKPSVAVIDGICTTGAVELVMSCDLRLVAETAQISDWHLKNTGAGVGAWGAATRLSRLVGLSKAKELILTGMVIDGREAWRIGFANRVYAPGKLWDGAMEVARAIAGMRPEGVRVTLAHIDQNLDMSKHQALRWAQLVKTYIGVDTTMDEAARSFVEKKKQG